jgi:hypothetical protein
MPALAQGNDRRGAQVMHEKGRFSIVRQLETL